MHLLARLPGPFRRLRRRGSETSTARLKERIVLGLMDLYVCLYLYVSYIHILCA